MILRDLSDDKYYPCGVYRIVCLINNNYYWGSAIAFSHRKNDHLRKLRNQKHCSPNMQSDFDLYGPEGFAFEIVRRCHPKERRAIEARYVKESLSDPKCYNVNNVVVVNFANRKISHRHVGKVLIDPKGNKVTIDVSVREFSAINGLDYSAVRQLLNGQRLSVKQWKVYTEETQTV